MDEAIQAKAEQVYERLGHYSRSGGDDIEDIEAALTAVWDEAIEAAEITVVPSIYLGEAQVAKVREKIRRLRKPRKGGGE